MEIGEYVAYKHYLPEKPREIYEDKTEKQLTMKDLSLSALNEESFDGNYMPAECGDYVL